MDPIDALTRLQIKCERVEKERDKFRDALWALREEFTALQMRSEKIECENAELKETISFGFPRRTFPDIVQPPHTVGEPTPPMPLSEKAVPHAPVLQQYNSLFKPVSLLGKRPAMKVINNNSESEVQSSPSKRVRFAEKDTDHTVDTITISHSSPPGDHEVDPEAPIPQETEIDSPKHSPVQSFQARIKTQWDPQMGKRVPINKQSMTCRATLASDDSRESELLGEEM